ncbi:MAG: hypothetical protein AAFP77_11825 [Bacteroidota bacterium]
MRLLLLLSSIITLTNLSAQRVVNIEFPVKGEVVLTEKITIPKVTPGYTLWLPPTDQIQGLVVFTHPRRDTINSDFMIDYALANHLAVIYATTDNRLEFFFAEDKMQEIENYLQEVLTEYEIPADNMLYCGMSLEGTRAMRLAMYGASEASQHRLQPKAIAICDAPLDMVRFHREMVKAKKLAYTPTTENEGTWVSGYLEANFGGTPADTLAAYTQYSPYCYLDDDGPNLAAFTQIAIRAYTEPDVQWWMETRGKDYYAMNAIDLAAFVNALHVRGHQKVTLITTRDKGYLPDGSRHPHSWGIVDEKDLIDWFLSLE